MKTNIYIKKKKLNFKGLFNDWKTALNKAKKLKKLNLIKSYFLLNYKYGTILYVRTKE